MAVSPQLSFHSTRTKDTHAPETQFERHFQLLKLAPSDINTPCFVLPFFLFVEFHFQRLKMHFDYQI
tara:strand:+ start:267 stop:467 length:201 start_codon:yes stop_codon:yes gene_type:complete